jgi:mannose-6-phosphate isomerase-like protein (cupin superfamily)
VRGRLAAVSYTIKNLRDTEDAAAAGGFGEFGEAHFPFQELDAERTGIGYQVLKPGKRSPFGHRHNNAEEIYVILAGEGRMKLDDEIVDVRPLDAIRVAPAVMRAFEAGSDGLSLVVFGPRHEGDGEIQQDFWTD